MSELPNGWTSCTIGEAMESTIGGVWGAAPGDAEIDVDVIRVTEMKAFGRLEPITAARRSITMPQLSSRSLQPGDLVLEKSGGGPNTPVGRVGMVTRVDRPAVCSNFMQLMRPNRDLHIPRFLMWHLVNAHLTGVTASLQTATTNIRNLKMKDYWEVRLSVPPLPEQERIVVAIEEAFSKLDAGETGLRTVRQLLKRMREAVLAAAVTGRLVPQDPTDTPTTKLIAESGGQSYAGDELSDLPDRWCWSTLRGVSLSDGYGSSVKCSYDAVGVGVLRIPNIQDGRVDLVDLKRAPEGAIPDILMLAPGDLLIVRTNGSRDLIGRSAPVTLDTGCSFASYLIRFRLDSEVVDGEYVSLMLSSSAWRRRLEASAASSAGQYNLSLQRLEPMPVAVPPLAEQRRIVAEVDRQLSLVQACERAVDAGLAHSAALRRSVLKAAFEGRLVLQDSSDEPASVLLERVQAERAASDGSSGGRRRSKVEAS
jgi:type I restriction enzyme, S subunit